MQAFTISIKTEIFPILHRHDHCFHTYVSQVGTVCNVQLVKWHAEYDATVKFIIWLKFIFHEIVKFSIFPKKIK